jgi:hypothetical protein
MIVGFESFLGWGGQGPGKGGKEERIKKGERSCPPKLSDL